MADEGFKRKLTAILSADAVGYSRLMAEDEAATVMSSNGIPFWQFMHLRIKGSCNSIKNCVRIF